MIKTAVILAAGLGSRIRKRIGERPKGFLTIDGKAIIEKSITNLLEMGISKIFIGTGYMHKEYEELVSQYPQIQCVFNPKYSSSGSMYTLYQFKDYINEDFLLLESDLIYEKAALETLLDVERPDVILASQFSNSGDEVYLETDRDHFLINMSKEQKELKAVYAELVGITKLSYQTFHRLCTKVKEGSQCVTEMDYEDGLIAISKDVKIFVKKLDDLVWCEVDDENHWTRAVNYIYPIIKARENIPASVKRNVLLNPGPATTSDTVKYAQVVPDICPRENEFGELMEFVSIELTKFVGNPNAYETVLFGGSGTAAVESILSSVIDQDPVLIVNNGSYGKRMCQVAEAYNLDYLEYKSEPDEAINLNQLEVFINKTPKKASHLAIVHCETTTGLLNDIEAVGELCKKYNMSLIVDAMSSFAAIPIDMDKMNISYLAASSNKNLQGMAGISFVIARTDQLLSTQFIKPRTLYLHLYQQYAYFKKTKQMRFTPPVQTFYALKQAIIEAKWEGIQNRYNRYSRSWETLMDGISKLGLKHLVSKTSHSKIITSIIEPSNENYDFQQMHDFFYENGFTIYPGKLDRRNTFRIANIGNITYLDMETFINLLKMYLEQIEGIGGD